MTDLHTELQERLKRLEELAEKEAAQKSHLAKEKHPQKDFFLADIFDAVSFRNDIASMEHPIFALKSGDTKPRQYDHHNASITVRPAVDIGIATIHDKDIWIYCISKLMQAMYEGEEINRTVRFTAYDYLITTNRDTSGRAYERMKNSLDRLAGTRITTEIKTDGKREASGFGLIDAWRIIEEDDKERMVSLEVTLPDWLYRSVTSKAVLTISPDYFRLRKPLDRRVYELARKHCGHQATWKISLDLLQRKTGSTSSLKLFRQAIKSLARSNELPDYLVEFDAQKDMLIFYNRDEKIQAKYLEHVNNQIINAMKRI